MRRTAWLAGLVMLFHALVLAAHVPPDLRAALAPQPVAHTHHHGNGHPSPAHHPVDHLEHCPLCLTLHGSIFAGPVEAPVLRPPDAIETILRRASVAPPGAGRSPRPYAARAPPPVGSTATEHT